MKRRNVFGILCVALFILGLASVGAVYGKTILQPKAAVNTEITTTGYLVKGGFAVKIEGGLQKPWGKQANLTDIEAIQSRINTAASTLMKAGYKEVWPHNLKGDEVKIIAYVTYCEGEGRPERTYINSPDVHGMATGAHHGADYGDSFINAVARLQKWITTKKSG